ncbi:hypothetical protein RDABS01_027699 [Bienertia sinuspersici]
MDTRLKLCMTDAHNYTDCGSENGRILTDRLITLPDVAAACVSCKRLMCVFRWITSLDFDDSPAISHCVLEHYGIERFPIFVTFVDSVIRVHQSDYLTKFRLGIGPVDRPSQCSPKHPDDICQTDCFPDLKATQINAWISLPLTRCGLRELASAFMLKRKGVLKLNVNLGLDRVAAMPSFRLPKLKLLALLAIIIPESNLVTRLVSSCPLLEDLTVIARWNRASFISISSPSLRRFCFEVWNEQTGVSRRDFVHIHAPKLEYFKFFDDLALRYSITNMDWLLEADICIHSLPNPMKRMFEVSGQIMLSLIRPLYNVQHLVLNGECTEELNYDKVKDQLPVFPNLKHLSLCSGGWGGMNKVLSAFRNCSPVLEFLEFPLGSASDYESGDELVL